MIKKALISVRFKSALIVDLAEVKLSIAVYLRNYMRGVIARFSGDEITPMVI